ncbi:uncharacterized protein LOC121378630 [Gigantopelta aegis]|uniref:uncharacterized protein LOC121378630 n=1 Tax=Gigantopelta aegis TaxID=1735272 RepID=UPI001B88AFB3|nr:uncharacterized protein LOC121378630 [Gigantopelta aegis]
MSLLDDCIKSTWSHVLRSISLTSGFILFAAGFLFPVWKTDRLRPDTQSGLWQNCSTSLSECHTFGFSEIPAWMHIVRVTELFAAFFYCWTLQRLYGIKCYANNVPPSTNWRKLPTLACSSGVLGFCGMLLYGFHDDHLLWSVMLVGAGSVLGFIVGCFIFFFHDTIPRNDIVTYNYDPRPLVILHF